MSVRKIEYYEADGRKMPLEISIPDDDNRLHPCLMFFYGGGFARRNMDNFTRHIEHYLEKGYVCVNADYRLAQETGDLKRCYQDGLTAFERVMEIADEYAIDVNRIILCGSSSGGSLAAHVSLLTGKPQAQILLNPGIAWQYDNVRYIEQPGSGMQEIIEAESVRHDKWEAAYNLLETHKLINTLIVVGTHDEVCYRGSSLFHQKALDLGYPSQLVLIEGLSHGQMNYGRSENNFGYETSIRVMDEYLETINREETNEQ